MFFPVLHVHSLSKDSWGIRWGTWRLRYIDGGYEIVFIAPDKNVRRCKLSEAAGLPFHEYLPVRKPAAYRKQRHLPGYYYFSTTQRHILYESRLEMSVLSVLWRWTLTGR